MDFTTIFFNSVNEISNSGLNNRNLKDFFISANKLLNKASKVNRIHDKFTTYYYEPTFSLICFLKSEKTKTTYNLLYDLYTNEIIFYSYIHNWENIKNIHDSYWSELLDIANKYEVKFSSDSGPFYDKEKTPEFNANYKSLVFNLMSTYITAMLEPKNERQNIGFGQLEISWNAEDKSIPEIINELNIAFKTFYRFNYLLWKSEDLRRQNRINRQKKI